MRRFVHEGDAATLTSGKLHEYALLPRPVDPGERRGEVRELRVEELGETQATVALDALVRYPRAEVRLGGPVVLERVGGEWRIVDYVRDGRRALEQVHLPLATVQRSGPAELTVVAVRESPKVDTVVATLRNDGDEPLRVTRASGFVRGAWRAGAVQAGVEAPPRGTVTFWAGVWTSEDAPRVAYELRCGGKAIWLDVAPRLDGAREEQPPPRRRPRGLLRRRRALLQLAAVIVVPLVLVAALGPSGWLTGLLLAYVVGFGWAGVQIARGSGARAASLAFGLAGAMLVAAVALWAVDRSTGGCDRAAARRTADRYARARHVDVRTRQSGGALCGLVEAMLQRVNASGPCFSYDRPAANAPLTVTLSCEGDRWRVGGG